MNTAQTVIAKFGGVRPMARKTNIPPTTIQYWWETGVIPSRRMVVILETAEREGIPLELSEMVGAA